jgi:hypothetical protein
LVFETGKSLQFYQAQAVCSSLGGHLAVIRDQNSHDAIFNLTGQIFLMIGLFSRFKKQMR